MRKILAMLFACSMVLAGCIDLTDEDVAEIVDELVDIAGCNDATAYNYDENATNNNACLTELVLKDSVTQFIHLVNEGPEWNETAGFVMAGSEVDDDGASTIYQHNPCNVTRWNVYHGRYGHGNDEHRNG